MFFFTCCADLLASLSTLFQVTGFFKGMSFPLASITVYNSAVFGFFSNTQRFISNYRYGDGQHPCSMLDLTMASMLTGLMSVSLGAPVDLVKIRLQMQTQMVLAGNVGITFFRFWYKNLLFLYLSLEKKVLLFLTSLRFWHIDSTRPDKKQPCQHSNNFVPNTPLSEEAQIMALFLILVLF